MKVDLIEDTETTADKRYYFSTTTPAPDSTQKVRATYDIKEADVVTLDDAPVGWLFDHIANGRFAMNHDKLVDTVATDMLKAFNNAIKRSPLLSTVHYRDRLSLLGDVIGKLSDEVRQATENYEYAKQLAQI